VTPRGQGRSSTWRRYQYVITPVLLLLPSILLFSVFVVYPLLETIRLSFYTWDGIGPKTWIGLDNYRELIADPVFHTAIGNNLIWLSLFFAAPVAGFFLALLLSESVSGIRFIRPLFFAPFVISQVVVGLVFAWVLHGEFGLLKAAVDFFDGPGVAPLASEHWSIFAVVAAGLWPQTAYCAILYLTALTTVRSDLLDAARSDRARGWRLLRYVVLPQLRPVTFVVLLVCIVSALRSFDLVMVMTGGGPYDRSTVLALYMYEQAFGSFRFGYAAAIATVLLVSMIVTVSYFLRRLIRRESELT
jgi:multiple sugar transport system permease protein